MHGITGKQIEDKTVALVDIADEVYLNFTKKIIEDTGLNVPTKTPIDSDNITFSDSEYSNRIVKTTWTLIKSFFKTYFDTLYIALTGDQTIAGIKTFASFPVTPSSDPTTQYQVANKGYVDGIIVESGGNDNNGGGRYIKFKDGTMIQWGKLADQTVPSAGTGIDVLITFPQAFVGGSPFISGAAKFPSWPGAAIKGYNHATTPLANGYLNLFATTGGSATLVMWQAIGRWKA